VGRIPGGKSVYQVADFFRERCLVQGKSMLWPQHTAWTLQNASALWAAFVDHPDTSQRTFIEKWHDQLLNESEDVHRVAVELIVFYHLFPMNIGFQAKSKELDTIINWKLSEDKPDLTLIHQAFDHGLGNAGPHYLLAKPSEIAFYLQFSIRIMRDKIDPHDVDACKELADLVRREIPETGEARHIALHLFFPDQFERIASETHRRRIVEAFNEEAGASEDQDSALFNIRRKLQKKFGRELIDFYDKDIQPLWRGDETEPIQFWIEKTKVHGRADREDGLYALSKALWSPQKGKGGADIYRFMREATPGDVVLHLTDNEAFTAASRVESSYEEFGGIAGTEWGLGPSYLVKLRDAVSLDPPLPRTVFFSAPYSERLVALNQGGTKNLFYDPDFSLHQGAYFTPAPTELIRILDDAYQESTGKALSDLIPEIKRITATSETTTTWIFQGNPELYDVSSALRALKEQSWLVTKFKDQIKVGDKVYLWQSGPDGGLVGVANVIAPPQMRSNPESERPFIRSPEKFEGEQVKVILKISRIIEPPITRKSLLAYPQLSELSLFRQPAGTNFRVTRDEAQALDAIISGSPIPKPQSTPTLTDLEEVTNLPFEDLKEIESLLQYKKQLILEGPPGAGKTYVAELFARYFSGNRLEDSRRDNLLTVQFHQSYGYEDFIQGIRPKASGQGQLSYRVEPGIFKTFCDDARQSKKPFVIVIDEINRGNISRIFGELLFLIEYREKAIPLPYDMSLFSIPSNVFIIGTMNTTDRSLSQIDYALRRRFYFYRLLPVVNNRAPVLERALEKLGISLQSRERVLRLFIALNNRVQERLGEHFQVGHSHFMRADIGDERILIQVWNRAVLPLLEEYFYNSRDRSSVLSEFTIEKLLAE
jgi:hypothetical protein